MAKIEFTSFSNRENQSKMLASFFTLVLVLFFWLKINIITNHIFITNSWLSNFFYQIVIKMSWVRDGVKKICVTFSSLFYHIPIKLFDIHFPEMPKIFFTTSLLDVMKMWWIFFWLSHIFMTFLWQFDTNVRKT